MKDLLDDLSLIGAVASLIGMVIAIWQACIAKKAKKSANSILEQIKIENNLIEVVAIITRIESLKEKLYEYNIKNLVNEEKVLLLNEKNVYIAWSSEIDKIITSFDHSTDRQKETLSNIRNKINRYISANERLTKTVDDRVCEYELINNDFNSVLSSLKTQKEK